MDQTYVFKLNEELKSRLDKFGENNNSSDDLKKLIELFNSEKFKVLFDSLLDEGVNSNEELSLLGTILRCCSEIYEHTGESTGISDSEYDTLVEYYRDKSGLDIIGSSIVDSEGAFHKYPSLRGTLDKIYKLTEDDYVKNKSQRTIEDWINSSERKIEENGIHVDLLEEEVYGFPKFDGVSCIFECDEKGNLVRALTRGNTATNEATDITKIVKSVFKDPIKNPKGKHGLKTEIMMKNDDLENYNKTYNTNYKNTRSIVSSILNSLEVDERVNYLEIVPLRYSYLNNDGTEGKQMLAPGAFEYPYISCKLKELDKLHSFAFSHATVNPGLRCDGMVIYLRNEKLQNILGRSNNRQKFEVAFKFTEEVAYSKVIDVEFTTGLFGRMNPRVVFKPVKMKGNTIERASLGSFDRFKDLQLAKGDKIKILYDIIPYGMFDDNDPKCKRSNNKPIEAPIICPECSHALEENENGSILYCTNPDCPCRIKGKILNYLNKMDIGEISYETVDDFYEEGYLKSIKDLYKLKDKWKSLIQLNGYGENKVQKIIDEIDKHRTVTPSTLFGSIGIESIGVRKFKPIFQMYSVDEVLDFSINNMIEVFTVVPGIKEKSAEKIVDGIKKNYKLIEFLLDELNVIDEPKSSSGDFKVVFTKVRDSELEDFIKEYGGEVSDSLTKDTKYLVVPMLGIKSSKVTKAEKYGIEIIPINELKDKIISEFS